MRHRPAEVHRMLAVRENLPLGRDHHGPSPRAPRDEFRSSLGFQMSEEGKTGASPPPAQPLDGVQPSLITIEDFRRLALRIGTVIGAQDHPHADRLLVLTVDVGEGAPRQLVAGIKTSYRAQDIVGKQVVVVTNLKPAVLRGVESQGMVLAASDGGSIALITPQQPIRTGSTVK